MEAKIKKYGTVAAGVLLTLLVINTLAKRVGVVQQVKSTVENGL